ncbi:MAG: DUF4126 domain-containing protein [Thermoanaerobaculaceae bacterium]|nr:DUF4126 domain-containing protein [Thermoanaerobaculaceae bacterium]MDI9620791.1 DUF4126 domain-containing protein [Acidobacteriota bacterium]NLH10823.1 DUF4126 domain-containing protein [Holophagae bacterium]HPW56222.1 DUF4126 domain-containing protein [Thermoanaerobaculaceae bacterium]
MDASLGEVVLAVCLGLGLAAAAGLRIFVPPFVLSAASLLGLVKLAPGLGWMGSWPALLAFGVALGAEISAYFVPWLDNLLDALGAPLAVLAGVVLLAAPLESVSPLTRWTLAVLVGGAAAGGVHIGAALLRKASSLATGGLANWVVATGEAVMAFSLAVLAVVLPLLAVACVLLALALARRLARPARG